MTNLVQIVAQPFELIQNGTIPPPFVKVVWREKKMTGMMLVVKIAGLQLVFIVIGTTSHLFANLA
jgi:hypothetical protein